MLLELRVENLLLVERAELRLDPGLNVLTGETGAGKTMLAHALDLLLGGKARHGIVRTGAAEAYVEGIFTVPRGLRDDLAERIPEGAEEVVLSRRVWPDGRTRAYVCGRAATVADLRDLGPHLLSFYGQHEHRKLMLGTVQLEILDGHAGEPARELRARLGELYASVHGLERQRDELAERGGARERDLDLLDYEIGEIEAAAPEEGELDALAEERERLRNVEALQLACTSAVEALAGEGAVTDRLAAVAPALEGAARLDASLAPMSERLDALRYEAEDLSAELRRYGTESDAAPERLEEVEERHALLSRLARKYGGTLEDVRRHLDECRVRREALEQADERLANMEERLGRARSELEELAGELSAVRRDTAPRLAAAVRERLAELAMGEARFEVIISPRAGGCGPRGADSVEMTIAPNPGMPAGGLRDIASGGELSRVMLALLSVAHGQGNGEGGGEQAMLVFDEIDAGIGGHTARAVGQHLRELAKGRQVLCITHLAQVAALATRHFTIVKDVETVPARTEVQCLREDGVVGELVRMLGAGADDAAADEHARSLLRAA